MLASKPMKKIIVASENPVKINAALEGFQAMFPQETFKIEDIAVFSGVSSQPLSDGETLLGALNRVQAAYEHRNNADYWVGLEGGIEEQRSEMGAFAWAVVRSQSMQGKGKTGTYFLPHIVAELIRNGKELGEADDIVFNRYNSKQEMGGVGILTDNVLDRTSFYKTAIILALIPFKNTELY